MSPQRIRSLLRWALVVALLFFAFAVRVVTSAAAELRTADEYRTRGDIDAAVVH